MVRVRVGLRLGQGKSLFPVGSAKDQRLPAGPIATASFINIPTFQLTIQSSHPPPLHVYLVIHLTVVGKPLGLLPLGLLMTVSCITRKQV